jgi:nicotinamidase-related amidase
MTKYSLPTVNTPPVLVLVDVQPEFVSHDHPCLTVIEQLLQDAIANNCPIITLRDGSTCLHICVERHVSPLPDSGFVRAKKAQWDGSVQIAAACSNKNFPTDTFVICGSYSGECVMATVLGLREMYPDAQIIVATDACCDSLHHNGKEQKAWNWYHLLQRQGNIHLALYEEVQQLLTGLHVI